MKIKPFELTAEDRETLKIAKVRLNSNALETSLSNLFALCMYLRVVGYVRAGDKIARQALTDLGLEETFQERFLSHLDGNELALAEALNPNAEITDIIQHHLGLPSALD